MTRFSGVTDISLSSQPFLGSSDSVNQINGKIKLGKEVLATLEGHWVSITVKNHTICTSKSAVNVI